MAENKTTQNNDSVAAFLKKVDNAQKRDDCTEIVKMMESATGEKAKMWGTAIIGFGSYHLAAIRRR
mgnify:CR=1 FL=1